MFLRLYSRAAGGRGLLKCLALNHIPAMYATTSSVPQTNSEKRDLVNFPPPRQLETSPEVQLGFIPKAWFDFLYPKTGVSGPYMLLAGLTIYSISKEWFVLAGEYGLVASFVGVLVLIQNKFGEQVKSFLGKAQDEWCSSLEKVQFEEKNHIEKQIEVYQKSMKMTECVLEFLPNAKRENVYLQLEAAYRGRLAEVHEKVKRLLDYQLESDEIHHRFAQKNMVNWVINSVEKSITPKQKQAALQQCIKDLKGLAARA